jgi:predicted Zn-dependent peptidase
MTEKIHQTVLENGLRVITEPIDSVRSASIGFWVKTGSRNESDEQAGITHFLEHMFFKGTAQRSPYQIAASLESLGGHLNAFTGTEYTCYYARCLDSHLPVAVEVLSDMVNNSTFPTEEISKEKKVVLEEMKMYKDSPDDYIFEEFSNQVFLDHPLGRPIIGFENTVKGIDQNSLFDYVDHRYFPSNMIIAAAGNVHHDEVLEHVENYFQGRVASNTYTPTISKQDLPKSPQAGERRVLEKKIEQTHYIIGKQGLSNTDPLRYQLLLINTILSGGMSARLHQNIREKYGYCYSVNSFIQSFSDTGMFGVYVGTDREYLEHVRDLILIELKRLQDEKISDKELFEAKSQLKGKLLLAQENMSNRMTRLAKSQIYYDRYVPLDELIEEIDSVRSESVLEFAGQFLNSDSFVETVLQPES